MKSLKKLRKGDGVPPPNKSADFHAEDLMKNAIVNRKNLIVILGVVLMAIGAQGISYGQTADEYPPAGTITLLKDGIKIGSGHTEDSPFLT